MTRLHQHTRDCYDDAGPGHGVSVVCGLIAGVDLEPDLPAPTPTPSRYLVTGARHGCRALRHSLADPAGYGLPSRTADAVRELIRTRDRGHLEIPGRSGELRIDWHPAGDERPGVYLVEVVETGGAR